MAAKQSAGHHHDGRGSAAHQRGGDNNATSYVPATLIVTGGGILPRTVVDDEQQPGPPHPSIDGNLAENVISARPAGHHGSAQRGGDNAATSFVAASNIIRGGSLLPPVDGDEHQGPAPWQSAASSIYWRGSEPLPGISSVLNCLPGTAEEIIERNPEAAGLGGPVPEPEMRQACAEVAGGTQEHLSRLNAMKVSKPPSK